MGRNILENVPLGMDPKCTGENGGGEMKINLFSR